MLEFLNRHKNWSLGGVIAKAIYSTEKSKQQTEIYRIWIIIIEKLIELSKYEDMTLEFIFFNFYLSRYLPGSKPPTSKFSGSKEVR
ncbi:hypothetical protein CN470_12460 [Bacillus cereus]|uniref:Uncharacterized protein n=1 Tax=Bacillus cereus TaxID=1396 RepID=A0A9X7BDT9_BACCE|nr:Hypothetical protein NF53_2497 [Bacillus thuringiensis serovar indiana]ANE85779.1 hypothetical protein DA68_09070 [Bacillus cereus]MBG9641460.1 hypothetical protein [Bacillus thuringiensis]OHO75516.1 hypothetical protein HMPREF2590_13590 [Bacillus sp. HMSC036E02]ASJ48782.1 hypothetical protein BA204_12190 [Bacillus cereus]